MRKSPKFSPEVVERAVRMVFDAKEQYPSQWAAIESIAAKIGCTAETLRRWVRQGERDSGARRADHGRAAARQGTRTRGARAAPGQRNPEAGERVFRAGGARPPLEVVMPFVDEHRERFGVEPICKALQVAPSAYWREAARRRDPGRWPPRRRRDAALVLEIERVWSSNMRVYGADKVCKQLRREQIAVARCTVERLMRRRGLRGVIRGKSVRTTVPDAKAPCPMDRVNRAFRAERPNQLWVSDFTYVSTWQGFVYVAFVIDVFARVIVGWRVSSSMKTDFVLDALEQALYARQAQRDGELVHHSDRGSRTAGYVTRMSGGVGGRGREASSYPD